MFRLIPLVLLLAALGAPSGSWARDVQVAFSTEGPPGIYGVACDRSLFGHVEGNAQALCGDLPDRTALIFIDEIDSPALLLGVLRHEAEHFRLGVDPSGTNAWESFREREAYAAQCRYSWVPACKEWLR